MTPPTTFERHLVAFEPQLKCMARSRACRCVDAESNDLDEDAEGEPGPDDEQHFPSDADGYRQRFVEAQAFVVGLAQGSRTPWEAQTAINKIGPGYERIARRIASGEIREPEAVELVLYWQSTFLPALQRVARQRPVSVAPSCPF